MGLNRARQVAENRSAVVEATCERLQVPISVFFKQEHVTAGVPQQGTVGDCSNKFCIERAPGPCLSVGPVENGTFKPGSRTQRGSSMPQSQILR